MVIVFLCAGAARFTWQYMQATAWVDHTTDVINEIRGVRMLLPGTAVLSGPALQFKLQSIDQQVARAAAQTRDNPCQQASLSQFREVMRSFAEPAHKGDLNSIAAANVLLDRMQQEEYRLLTERLRVQSEVTRDGAAATCALCLALLILGVGTTFAARREFRRRAAAELALVRDKEELTRYNRELALVAAASQMIQAATSEEQVQRAVESFLRELTPGSRGYCGVISPSNDLVEIAGSWGGGTPRQPFHPSECLALQLGHPIHRSESPVQVRCSHLDACNGDYVCMPVRSASGHLGVLHVESSERMGKKRADVLAVFAAHVALGLTNLRMREALQRQTVRDPLTALFNRRYFDETLQRELAACGRHGSPLSVIMLDVDHFKEVNDTWGHAAGDDALRSLAQSIRSGFRESDVLCRYGGEEFAILLPQATLEDAWTRVEQLRMAIARKEMSSGGNSLGRITISAGVASSAEFPTPAELVHAADVALYEAKRSGRNACWVCSDDPLGLPAIRTSTIQLLSPENSEELWAVETVAT